jgi:energy-converting hydrogenase A subunit D
MDDVIMAACVILVLLGTFSAILGRDPFNKLISLSVMVAGVFPFIVDRGYLDVAAALALIAPLSTIFILMICQRSEPS